MESSSVQEQLERLRDNISRVIIGLDEVTEVMVISAISGGHILLEGPPGLGKTTLARTFAQSIEGSFKRVQMTPDLLPSDILGVNVYNPYDSTWVLRRGPIFANLVLVDEINRASPKVQSAFLEVMQERQVTIENETLELEEPFMVLATQLPLGELGTYPLTSVQIDRFAYRVELDNPDKDSEYSIIDRINEIEETVIKPVLSNEEILELSKISRGIHVGEHVKRYIVDLVHDLRNNPLIRSGPSPRASIWLLKSSRVRAMIEGREYVVPDDVKSMVKYVVPHRLEVTSEARVERTSVMDLVKDTLGRVLVPKGIEQ